MFLRKAALRPVPTYAVVGAHFIELIEESFDDEELQQLLDTGFRDLDNRQPALATFLAEQLADGTDELVQSLGYFLSVTIYLAFREAFPRRLSEIDVRGVQIAAETLAVDEQIRANDPTEVLDSDDVVAMGQPALLSYVQHHVQEALEQCSGEVDLDELDEIYRAILIEVIALSHAVVSPTGEVGPSREALA